MLSRFKEFHEERERGFTLVELLVVMLIIGILSAIAVPMFMNQRKAAVDSSVQNDLKNVSLQIETALISYPEADIINVTTNVPAQIATVTFTSSANTGTALGTVQVLVSEGTRIITGTINGSGAFTGGDSNPYSMPYGYVLKGTNEGGDVTDSSSTGLFYKSNLGGMAKQ